MSEDERAIRDLVERWMSASKTGDIATVLSLMADDVVFMVPGREPFGKEAFKASSESMANLRFEGRSNILELEILGDCAYMRTYIDMTITPPDGEPVRRSGYTLTILHKNADGRWQLSRDANLVA